jgi:CBS domain-containing protein
MGYNDTARSPVRVSELMSPDPAVVGAHAPLEACGRALVRLRVRHLPVVAADGTLAGVVTDAGVFRHGGFVDQRWLSFEAEYDRLVAADVAVPAEVVLGPDDDADAALRHLFQTRQDFVVVVDERRHPVGILTEHDGVRVALGLVDGGLDAAREGSRPVLSVARDARASDALDRMTTHGVRHLVVTDTDGTVYGVLTYSDLWTDDAGRRPELKAEDVVRSRLVRTAPVGTKLREVALKLRDDHIGCMPIVDEGGRPVAIVTRRDVIDAAVSGLEAEELFDEDTDQP